MVYQNSVELLDQRYCIERSSLKRNELSFAKDLMGLSVQTSEILGVCPSIAIGWLGSCGCVDLGQRAVQGMLNCRSELRLESVDPAG